MTRMHDDTPEPVALDAHGDEPAKPVVTRALIRASAGDEETPSGWEATGDMAALARTVLLDAASGTDPVAKAAFQLKVAALQQEVEGPAPTSLERLLAERIATCWLHLAYVETIFAQNMKTTNLVTKEYLQRRIDRAHARYLSAIRTLAQVRRLQRPSVQVNIAEQQVNVSQR